MELSAIASNYENLKCVECALALKDYLLSQGIHGKHIKLYTGSATNRNRFIYDDSVPTEAISENGRHEGIAVIINATAIVFDNHHPNGLPKEEWLANLQFFDKIHNQQQLQTREEIF